MVIFYNFKIAINLSEVNKKEVLQVIRNPRAITASQLKEIEKMAVDYPYFQGAHTLVAIGNKSRSAPDAPKSVVKAALYATDRKYLKALLSGASGKAAPQPAVMPSPNPQPNIPVREASPSTDNEVSAEQPKPASSQAMAQPKPSEPDMQPAFAADPIQESDKTAVVTIADHDDLLKEVFANLETLKKSKTYYLEVERQLEDAEFEEAQAKAVKKATGSKAADKVAKKKPAVAPDVKKKSGTKIAAQKSKQKAADTEDKSKSESAKAALPPKKKDQISIIDAFIKNNPSIKPATTDSQKAPTKDLSEPSQQLKDELITENLAQILVKQGKKEKAIEVYKKLILKVPQKKAYFATQIEELQK